MEALVQAGGKKQGTTWRNAQPVADYVSKLVDPLIGRRAGMTLDLIASWPEIVGEQHAAHSRPHKLDWPRRAVQDEPFSPAVLVVACEAAHVLYLQYETAGIIRRINTYFGFTAVERIRFVQLTVANRSDRTMPVKPRETRKTAARLDVMLVNIEDDQLRMALRRLGTGVFSASSDDTA